MLFHDLWKTQDHMDAEVRDQDRHQREVPRPGELPPAKSQTKDRYASTPRERESGQDDQWNEDEEHDRVGGLLQRVVRTVRRRFLRNRK